MSELVEKFIANLRLNGTLPNNNEVLCCHLSVVVEMLHDIADASFSDGALATLESLKSHLTRPGLDAAQAVLTEARERGARMLERGEKRVRRG